MSNIKQKIDSVGGKLSSRLPSKLRGKNKANLRITNDNIEERREEILTHGRKFKYPAQYSKIRMIIITIAIVIIALIAFSSWLWTMLYKKQKTDNFYYSVTNVLPLPVASVEGHQVNYSDYLRLLRSAIYYSVNKEGKDFTGSDGANELNYIKRTNLRLAERAAYVKSIASSKSISISSDEVNQRIEEMRKVDGATEETLISTLKSYYGWSLGDYRYRMRDQLLEQKVAFATDDKAKDRINQVESKIKHGDDFIAVAKEMSDDDDTKATGTAIVKSSDKDHDPTGIANVVLSLKENQTSSITKTSKDGEYYYYIAKLISKTDDEAHYSIVYIKLSGLDNDFQSLVSQDKIKEYISVPLEKDFKSTGVDGEKSAK